MDKVENEDLKMRIEIEAGKLMKDYNGCVGSMKNEVETSLIKNILIQKVVS